MSNEPGSKIKFDKVSAKSIASALVAEQLDPNGETEVIAKRLAAHYVKTDGAGEMYACTECEAPFPGRVKACCPFCAIDDDGNAVDTTPETFGAPAEWISKMPAEPGAPDAKTKKIEERAKKKEEAKVAKQPKPAKAPPKPKEPDVIDAVVENTTEGKAREEEVRKDALSKRDERKAALAAGQSELDAAVTNVVRLKSDVAHGYWQLGKELQAIYDKQLWKQRLDAEGKPGVYKTSGFDAFVREECGFTAASAYQIMDVAKHFSEEQVRAFGHSKLGLVLKAPSQEQARVLEEGVRAGKTANEIREMVDAAKKSSAPETKPSRDGSTRGGKREGAGRPAKVLSVPGGPPPEKTTKRDVITIASIPKRQKVAIMAKPSKRGEVPKPAKRIADEPYFTIEFENDVVLKVSLSLNPAGELVAICEARREKDDDGEE